MGKNYDNWKKRQTLASIENRHGKVIERNGKIYVFYKGEKEPHKYRDWDEASAFEDNGRYDPFLDY